MFSHSEHGSIGKKKPRYSLISLDTNAVVLFVYLFILLSPTKRFFGSLPCFSCLQCSRICCLLNVIVMLHVFLNFFLIQNGIEIYEWRFSFRIFFRLQCLFWKIVDPLRAKMKKKTYMFFIFLNNRYWDVTKKMKRGRDVDVKDNLKETFTDNCLHHQPSKLKWYYIDFLAISYCALFEWPWEYDKQDFRLSSERQFPALQKKLKTVERL